MKPKNTGQAHRLGGWLRLWIIWCVVYGVVITMVTITDTPSNAPPSTPEEFLHSLSDDSLRVIHRATEKKPTPSADLLRPRLLEIHPSEVRWDLDPIVVRAPDGFEYILPADATKVEKDRIRGEYETLMARRLREFRWSTIQSAVLLWSIPCLLLMGSGLAARWVYRGFRGSQT